MQMCRCNGLPQPGMNTLRLLCPQCERQVVRCRSCGQEQWWVEADRILALNAAESHRWETGHVQVWVRDTTGIVLREVLGALSAA